MSPVPSSLRVESKPRTLHQVTVYASAAALTKTLPTPVDGSRSAKNGAMRGGPVTRRPMLRSVLALSSSTRVMLPSELTNAAVCAVPKNGNENGMFTWALSSSVSVTRVPSVGAERAVDLRERIARAAAREAEAGAAHVERIERQDQVAGVLDDGDVADVLRDRRRRGDRGPRFAAVSSLRQLALICRLRRRSSAQRFSAIASARRPRGLPSTSVFLAEAGPLPCAPASIDRFSDMSASSAVVQGFAFVAGGGLVPPPPGGGVLPPPPPPQAARNRDTPNAIDRARVRGISRLPP